MTTLTLHCIAPRLTVCFNGLTDSLSCSSSLVELHVEKTCQTYAIALPPATFHLLASLYAHPLSI